MEEKLERKESEAGKTEQEAHEPTEDSVPENGEAPSGSPHPIETLLEDYPLREPGEDPVWSVRIVKGWLWFLAFSVSGILLLTILGFFYD